MAKTMLSEAVLGRIVAEVVHAVLSEGVLPTGVTSSGSVDPSAVGVPNNVRNVAACWSEAVYDRFKGGHGVYRGFDQWRWLSSLRELYRRYATTDGGLVDKAFGEWQTELIKVSDNGVRPLRKPDMWMKVDIIDAFFSDMDGRSGIGYVINGIERYHGKGDAVVKVINQALEYFTIEYCRKDQSLRVLMRKKNVVAGSNWGHGDWEGQFDMEDTDAGARDSVEDWRARLRKMLKAVLLYRDRNGNPLSFQFKTDGEARPKLVYVVRWLYGHFDEVFDPQVLAAAYEEIEGEKKPVNRSHEDWKKGRNLRWTEFIRNRIVDMVYSAYTEAVRNGDTECPLLSMFPRGKDGGYKMKTRGNIVEFIHPLWAVLGPASKSMFGMGNRISGYAYDMVSESAVRRAVRRVLAEMFARTV